MHRNHGAGFDATPTPWQLPYPEHVELCDVPAFVKYTHIDLDGDRRPELVFTGSCTSDEVGVSRWIVNRNLGTSFAASGESWPLPGGQAFYDLHRRVAPSHMTSDVDGDGRPDLVVLSRAGTDLGTTRWLYHRNTGAGFAPAEDWCLPGGYGDDAFASVPHESCGTFPYKPAWTLLDVDGAGPRELVVAHRCDASGSTVGIDRWLVHRR
ncbi:MAG: VCBS repeat-containing protein [Deltaproteobacteria bacterium]|nr:VCBS repeat-containing protein [Kofleriaceae bacterium]